MTVQKRRFKTLRWKLAWSYMWVTLVITMFLNCIVFIGLGIYKPTLTAQKVEYSVGRYAQDLARLWQSEAPTQQLVQNALYYRFSRYNRSHSSDENNIINSTLSTNLTPTIDEQLLIFTNADFQPNSAPEWATTPIVSVTDAQGMVIASSQPSQIPSEKILPETIVRPPIIQGITQGMSASIWLTETQQMQVIVPIEPGKPDSAWLFLQTPPIMYSRIYFIIQILLIYALSLLFTFISNGIIGLIFGFLASRPYVKRLEKLTQASAAVAQGDFSPRIEDPHQDEIAQLGQQFNWMTDQLANNLRSLRQLADHNAALAEQATQLATIEERNRLARELHDSVSQELFSVTMLAAAVENMVDQQPTQAKEYLQQLRHMLQRAQQETRALIFALRPAALGDEGLAPALRQLTDDIKRRQAMNITLILEGERRLPIEQEQALFRIAQEALANVGRHSKATISNITLKYSLNHTTMSISDNGQGFDQTAPRRAQSLGLISIEERVTALNGTIDIQSAPGEGTTIQVYIPRR